MENFNFDNLINFEGRNLDRVLALQLSGEQKLKSGRQDVTIEEIEEVVNGGNEVYIHNGKIFLSDDK